MKIAEALRLYSKPRHRSWGPEAALQYTVVEYLRLMPTDGTWFLHIPNEGRRTVAEGAHLKRMGLLPGAADLLIFVKGRWPLWLELKASGKTASLEQKAFSETAAESGHDWALVDNIGDALRLLRAWGALKPDADIRRWAA